MFGFVSRQNKKEIAEEILKVATNIYQRIDPTDPYVTLKNIRSTYKDMSDDEIYDMLCMTNSMFLGLSRRLGFSGRKKRGKAIEGFILRIWLATSLVLERISPQTSWLDEDMHSWAIDLYKGDSSRNLKSSYDNLVKLLEPFTK